MKDKEARHWRPYIQCWFGISHYFKSLRISFKQSKFLWMVVVIDGEGVAHCRCILACFTQNKLDQSRCQILGLCCQHPQGQDLWWASVPHFVFYIQRWSCLHFHFVSGIKWCNGLILYTNYSKMLDSNVQATFYDVKAVIFRAPHKSTANKVRS